MEKVLTIKNEDGLHARPAGLFAKKASEFKSQIEIVFNGQTKNAKSIMGLMGLGVTCGSEIILRATGEDAAQALEALGLLIENQFKAAQPVNA